MRIGALGIGRCHAPEQGRAALVSAYVAGADILCLSLRLTADDNVAAFEDATTDRLTGTPGKVAELDLKTLRALDTGATFTDSDGALFVYRARIESFGLLVDDLPDDVGLLLNLKGEADPKRRVLLAKKAGTTVANRGHAARTMAASDDANALAAFVAAAPGAATLLIPAGGQAPAAAVAAAVAAGAKGLLIPLADAVAAGGGDGPFADAVRDAYKAGQLPLGAVVAAPGAFPTDACKALAKEDFVHALLVESLLDAAATVRPGWRWIDEKWARKAAQHEDVDAHIWKLGYAKYNPEGYCHVYVDDGVIVDIKPFKGDVTYHSTGDKVADKLEMLLERSWEAMKIWPFYSGGGAGFAPGIEGAFSAEVDVESTVACQATTVEMAAINVDPATHRPPWIQKEDGSWKANLPTSFRDKHTFYDPHGAPPFVGVEHDEDDGWRINWNLGTDYDGNQYGKAVGDGKLLTGRMRLDRRGPWFAAYYRKTGKTGTSDWICAGVARNESLNDRIYLRLAGKRWRQENPDKPSEWMPVVANRFQFRAFVLTRFTQPSNAE